jgi:hypothetical protein
MDFFRRHLFEDFRRSGVLLAQTFGERAIDAVVFLFIRNGKREDFLLTELGKSFHLDLSVESALSRGAGIEAEASLSQLRLAS